jgi:hypothetical protein
MLAHRGGMMSYLTAVEPCLSYEIAREVSKGGKANSRTRTLAITLRGAVCLVAAVGLRCVKPA